MAWKMGQEVKVATPEGDVYVASNRIHNHSSIGHVLYTIDGFGRLVPFVVSEELAKSDERMAKSLDQVMGVLAQPK